MSLLLQPLLHRVPEVLVNDGLMLAFVDLTLVHDLAAIDRVLE